ncbi:hypothetical protein DPEC_G00143290 [Dallia pectoralis]|uniref:Uncharacterized protein n=1 Tax=Dallia pectoralis TaxID=75939 RepID=A0ACC2GN02_DALPE|nr:hypothetical protein DPEC_G00143290 [Dallia pectoralis]
MLDTDQSFPTTIPRNRWRTLEVVSRGVLQPSPFQGPAGSPPRMQYATETSAPPLSPLLSAWSAEPAHTNLSVKDTEQVLQHRPALSP